jgi:hypothetical protein
MAIFLASSLMFAPAHTVQSQSSKLEKGSYLNYDVLFRYMKFLNGSVEETPSGTSGTTNGTLFIDVKDFSSPKEAYLRLVLEIPHIYYAEKNVMFDTESQQIFTENHQNYLGFFDLWLVKDQAEGQSAFTISHNELTGLDAIATLRESTIIDTYSFGLQEVYQLIVNLTSNNYQYSWGNFYDKDTLLLIRMIGDVADPFLLGIFGVERIDFVISLTKTNLNLGSSQPTNVILILLSPMFLIACAIVAVFIVSLALLYKKQSWHRRKRVRNIEMRRGALNARSYVRGHCRNKRFAEKIR